MSSLDLIVLAALLPAAAAWVGYLAYLVASRFIPFSFLCRRVNPEDDGEDGEKGVSAPPVVLEHREALLCNVRAEEVSGAEGATRFDSLSEPS